MSTSLVPANEIVIGMLLDLYKDDMYNPQGDGFVLFESLAEVTHIVRPTMDESRIELHVRTNVNSFNLLLPVDHILKVVNETTPDLRNHVGD